ncbi:FeoA family protein [Natranaerobius trueperi]|uniref:Iron transporter FeoA n=1 Tax=Natranaerobius trueperi TaxID=759412 RepID=A0A226BWZ9_9FIRM|nr:FeoA family protein [Natranaerobius trueperi]OWZ83526.1 iron transporter FeoA [Natranaerobius trueperi]
MAMLKQEILREVPLDHLKEGQHGVINQTPSNPLLASLGFREGKHVTIKAKEIFKGPLICSIDDRNVAISRDVAKKVLIETY